LQPLRLIRPESRRFLQQPAASAPPESVLAELRARDERDRTRANSPLVPATDAVLINSTHLTLDQVLQRASEIIESRMAELQDR